MNPENLNLLLGIAGILGALAGALIGAYLGYRGALASARMQLEHQDRTRFQEHRLEAYTAFIHAADIAVSAIEAAPDVREAVLPKIIASIERMQEMYQRLKLCASDPVLAKAKLVHTSASRFTTPEGWERGATPPELMGEHMRLLNELEGAIRVELGVGQPKLRFSDHDSARMRSLLRGGLVPIDPKP